MLVHLQIPCAPQASETLRGEPVLETSHYQLRSDSPYYEYLSRPCSIPLIGRPAPTSGLPFRPPPSDLMRHVPCFLSANRSFVVMPLKPIVTRNKVPDSLAAGPWAADRL
ncbi:hypothetical protein CCM_03800 [Cordyceps militaris CM01]|uniref:Uncharacterized protein n=1 Tax=Cordyceps militaris (strain CM01) TaxID=983644 RepID=G3JGR3_CORMM|nr:uncharacterized protein CCM_03800 [Cordyceps militaris CM01]EGX92427.1 hypothetical protein CCM_03800 [Cordyceps militaris CM01]